MSKARQLADLGNVYDDGALSNRNRIINGAMVIDQRNAGAAVNSNAAVNPYVMDRWRSVALTGSGQFSLQRVADGPSGFVNSAKVTSLAATSVGASEGFVLRQPIEGHNIADLGFGTASAKPITLSFWAKSSLTGSFGGAVANNAADRSYPFLFTISAADTWEYKTITVAGDTTGTWPTDNTVGINLWFSLGMGSTRQGTAGAWAAADYRGATGETSIVGTSGATFYLTGVQLEVGDTATPFEHRSYGQELALCQRYYWTGSNINAVGIAQANVSDALFTVRFPVVMRAAPTATALSGGSADASIAISGTPSAGGATGLVHSTYPTHVFYSIQCSGGTSIARVSYNNGTGTASAEL